MGSLLKWYGLANIIAGFLFIYIFMWLDNWLATIFMLTSMVWVIFGWVLFDDATMEKLNDTRNNKRHNRSRANHHMGKSSSNYKLTKR